MAELDEKPFISFTIKELLGDIRSDVKEIKATLAGKVDRSEFMLLISKVDHLSTVSRDSERALEVAMDAKRKLDDEVEKRLIRLETGKAELEAINGYRRWLIPIMIGWIFQGVALIGVIYKIAGH